MISSNYVKARFRQKHDPNYRYSIPHHTIPLGRQKLEDILKKYPPKHNPHRDTRHPDDILKYFILL